MRRQCRVTEDLLLFVPAGRGDALGNKEALTGRSGKAFGWAAIPGFLSTAPSKALGQATVSMARFYSKDAKLSEDTCSIIVALKFQK